MPSKTNPLPHLTQTILLDRGQAHVVHEALVHVRRELLHREVGRQRLSTTEALTIKPLNQLLKGLLRLAERDDKPRPVPPPPKPSTRKPRRAPKPKPPKPHKFRVEFDQLATVRFYYGRLLATKPEHADQVVLAGVLARFHQPSLNLDQHIDLTPPNGPGAQTTLL